MKPFGGTAPLNSGLEVWLGTTMLPSIGAR
jgi:hypothetical protein